jgi:hypothetical protein
MVSTRSFAFRGALCVGAIAVFGSTPAWSDAPSSFAHVPLERAADAVAQSGGPVVVLTSPGEEPQEPLRYRLNEVTAEAIQMDLNMRMGAMLGMPAQTLPTNRMHMTFGAPTLLGDDALRVTFSLDRVEVLETEGVQPEILDAMRVVMAQMGSFDGMMEIGVRGDLRAFDIRLEDLAPAARAQIEGMRSSFDQMTVPLPAEAVGVGATWTVRQEVQSQGFRIDQTASYRLVERDDTAFTLAVEIRQAGADQAIVTPEVPAAAGVRGQLEGTGQGTMRIRFDSLIPHATLTSNVRMRMSAGSGADAQALPLIEMDIDMVLGPVAP